MNYRSIADLNDHVLNWCSQLPPDIDLIVGIPRSGLLVGTLLALHLNKPLADVDGLLQGRTLGAGNRLHADLQAGSTSLTVLVVDDSVWSGGQMDAVRRRIEAAAVPHRLLYGAVYVLPSAVGLVDYYYETLGLPRAFEWNIMHHPYLQSSCVVADGILWPEKLKFAETHDSGGPSSLAATAPLFQPSQPIGHLIVQQPGRARAVIEPWLARNGIDYQHIALIDPKQEGPADAALSRAQSKASLYRQTNAWIFIEPELSQAVLIAQLSKRPVFCFQSRQMIYPGVLPERRAAPLLRHRLQWRTQRARAMLAGKLHRLTRQLSSAPVPADSGREVGGSAAPGPGSAVLRHTPQRSSPGRRG